MMRYNWDASAKSINSLVYLLQKKKITKAKGINKKKDRKTRNHTIIRQKET
jgi:hypothetical protein